MIESGLLQAILEKEETVLQEMIELEEQTREILIARDAEVLQKLNEAKELLATKMLELEKQRAAAVPEGTTLKEYLHRENPEDAAVLENLRQSILSLYEDLNSRQRITRRLLLFNQQLVEQAMRLLLPRGGSDLYSASGEKKQQDRLRLGIINSNA